MRYDHVQEVNFFESYQLRFFIEHSSVIGVTVRNWIIVHMMQPVNARLSFQAQETE